MQNKICAVVQGATLKELKSNFAVLSKKSNLLELRADAAADFTLKDVNVFAKLKKNNTVIFTCRSPREGGLYKGAEKDRILILKEALKNNFDYVDFELSALKAQKLKFSAAERKKLIISYHNFSKVPPKAQVEKIKKQMLSYKPAVLKIAVRPRGAKELEILFDLLFKTAASKQNIIVIAMGDDVMFTRALFPLLGGWCTYAAAGKALAPGQYRLEDIQQIYKLIKAV